MGAHQAGQYPRRIGWEEGPTNMQMQIRWAGSGRHVAMYVTGTVALVQQGETEA